MVRRFTSIIYAIFLIATLSCASALRALHAETADSLINNENCRSFLAAMDTGDLKNELKQFNKRQLLEAYNCVLWSKSTQKVEAVFIELNNGSLTAPSIWEGIIGHYKSKGLKIEELLAIEDARNRYPDDSKLLLLEIEYHITNKTVPYYRRSIESKIRGGDVRYYAVNAALNLNIGRLQKEIDEKIRYYVYARQDLKKMQQINPNSLFSNHLLTTVNDSLDEVLLDRIEQSKDRKVIDSLFKLELAYFLDYLDIISGEATKKPLIGQKDIELKVKSWVRDTVYFQIENKSKINSNIRYKSTPHCVLIGTNQVLAGTSQSYKLCVQPSATQSQFELTPTFFFTNYAGSFSMTISGFVTEGIDDDKLVFESELPDFDKTFEVKVIDEKSKMIIYHAETSITNRGIVKNLATGVTSVKGGYGSYQLKVSAEGYKSTLKKINFENDNQLVEIYLEPIADELETIENDILVDTVSHFVTEVEEDLFKGVGAQHIIVLLDVSQSMKRNGHFAKVKKDLIELIGNLRVIDTISVLTFASSNTVIADHISAAQKDSLYRLIANIQIKGGTNSKIALRSGYVMAKTYNSPASTNVLWLITDGKLTAPGTSATWYEDYLMRTYRTLPLRLNVMLYSNEPSDFTFLEYLSKLTGGVTRPGIDHNLSKTFFENIKVD